MLFQTVLPAAKRSCFHSGEYQGHAVNACDLVQFGTGVPKFRRHFQPPPSRYSEEGGSESSVSGTWRGVPLLGALKIMKGRLWGQEPLFMLAQLGNLEEGSSTGYFETWMKGAVGMGPLSLWKEREGALGGASLGTLEDMLRKPPDTGIPFHRVPLRTEGNLEGGLKYRGLWKMNEGGL
jgi:hypothetical protein